MQEKKKNDVNPDDTILISLYQVQEYPSGSGPEKHSDQERRSLFLDYLESI